MRMFTDCGLMFSEVNLYEIARKLSGNTGITVLLKACHLSGDNLVDYFYDAEDGTMTKLPSKRVHCCNISKETVSILSSDHHVKTGGNWMRSPIPARFHYHLQQEVSFRCLSRSRSSWVCS